MIALRENPTMISGKYDIKALDDDVLIYKREITDEQTGDVIVVILNLGRELKTIQLNTIYPKLPAKMEIAVVSIQSEKFIIG